MDSFSHVPPGFRFHPTDEELVDYYLRKKIAAKRIDLDVIKDVDLYKIEPWDLEELCRIGSDEQSEWYFFSHKDKKYPTGTRTNRATKEGFWKATGRDKAIYARRSLIGMRKTLVFYKGRAPNGQKSDWIMHEYRLETNENGTPQEEGWAVCRVFKKKMATVRKMGDYDHSPCNWYDDTLSAFIPEVDHHDSPGSGRSRIPHHQPFAPFHDHFHYPCKQEPDHHQLQQYNNMIMSHHHHHHHHDAFLQLPQLESPKFPQPAEAAASADVSFNNHSMVAAPYGNYDRNTLQSSTLTQEQKQQDLIYNNSNNDEQAVDQVTDWRVLDKFVASQLSHDEEINNVAADQQINMEAAGNNGSNSSRQDNIVQEYASMSTSSCQIDLWK